MTGISLTARLARFVAEKPEADISDEVLRAAQNAFIDTMGVGLGGRDDHASAIAAEWLAESGGKREAQVWGRVLRLQAADAAFLNAIQAHVLDYDDSSLNLRGHPSATLVPVALAVGEVTGASGRQVLGAYALGLEASSKIGPALGPDHYFRGWHSTTTAGIFGATAVAARLLKLSAPQLQCAFGIVASQAAGLTHNFGTMTKALHVANAARAGIVAAQLARRGFTANPDILDDKAFFSTYAGKDAKPFSDQIERLGAPWELLDPGLYVKRWPCCYASHRSIAGILDMQRRHNIKAEDVEGIQIGFLPGAETPLRHYSPGNELEAKFSAEYPLAAALVDGQVSIESFADEQVNRPELQALMKKIKRFSIPDDKVYNGLTGYNDLKIRTRSGEISERLTGTPGAPSDLMTDQDRQDKFMGCAAPVLGGEQALRLHAGIAGLMDAADIISLWGN